MIESKFYYSKIFFLKPLQKKISTEFFIKRKVKEEKMKSIFSNKMHEILNLVATSMNVQKCGNLIAEFYKKQKLLNEQKKNEKILFFKN